VIAVDLPGFGATPPLAWAPMIAAHADPPEAFIAEQRLDRVACVGSSMGACLALELSRRGAGGPTVALDPGGFWNRREVRYFETSIAALVKLVRVLEAALPPAARNPAPAPSARSVLCPALKAGNVKTSYLDPKDRRSTSVRSRWAAGTTPSKPRSTPTEPLNGSSQGAKRQGDELSVTK
jgi:pimeloyl-ACP methyl ester carboxylesterase